TSSWCVRWRRAMQACWKSGPRSETLDAASYGTAGNLREIGLMTRTACFSVTLAAAFLICDVAPRAQQAGAAHPPIEAGPKATNHPRLAGDSSQLWLAPDAAARAATRGPAVTDFTQAVKLEVDNNFTKALPMLSQPAVHQGVFGHYAEYYQGLAELRLGRAADARRTFQALAAHPPTG